MLPISSKAMENPDDSSLSHKSLVWCTVYWLRLDKKDIILLLLGTGLVKKKQEIYLESTTTGCLCVSTMSTKWVCIAIGTWVSNSLSQELEF